MKKIIIVSTLFLLTLTLITGCVLNNNNSKNNSSSEKTFKTENSNSNSVVIYFSATGTTKKIAQKIAKYSNSDIIEIIPKEKYSSEDLNYNGDCRANREQNDSKARPQIKNTIDIKKYDTIYLGYPIWWGTNPKIILTLLDSYDFTDKKIIPFCTSGSSGITASVDNLRKYNPKLTIEDGKRFSKDDNDTTIKKFINDK